MSPAVLLVGAFALAALGSALGVVTVLVIWMSRGRLA